MLELKFELAALEIKRHPQRISGDLLRIRADNGFEGASAGMDVRLDGNPRDMHHKVLVIDREIVITGSYNFTFSAEHRNDENILIIDDPLLVERYGFLDYNVLRNSMRTAGYETTIAFIPWNYWRTSRKAALAVSEEPSLSICVHGCDNTNREFADVDRVVRMWVSRTSGAPSSAGDPGAIFEAFVETFVPLPGQSGYDSDGVDAESLQAPASDDSIF